MARHDWRAIVGYYIVIPQSLVCYKRSLPYWDKYMAYTLHIKCLKPFNNWEEDIPCNPKPSKICMLMRYMASQYPQCNITLTSGSEPIAYAKWSVRRKVHDLGVEPAWGWIMHKENA